MNAMCHAEVEQLHTFLEGWLGGTLPATADAFRRFRDVMAAEFEIISPDGKATGRVALIAGLEASHGAHKERTSPFRIRITAYAGRSLTPDLHLATYQEWQMIDGRNRGRLSSVLFRRRAGTPNGVEWVHLHETWLPGGSSLKP